MLLSWAMLCSLSTWPTAEHLLLSVPHASFQREPAKGLSAIVTEQGPHKLLGYGGIWRAHRGEAHGGLGAATNTNLYRNTEHFKNSVAMLVGANLYQPYLTVVNTEWLNLTRTQFPCVFKGSYLSYLPYSHYTGSLSVMNTCCLII